MMAKEQELEKAHREAKADLLEKRIAMMSLEAELAGLQDELAECAEKELSE